MLAKSLAVALFVSVVAAQSSNDTINPSSITLTLRNQWCQGQQNTCGTLCSGDPGTNNCDPDTLTYNCTCAANNSAPGLQYYTQTIPTFECEQIFQNCINSNVGDAAAQALCNTNEKANCGHLDPDNFTETAATTSSASMTATSTSSSGAATGSSTGTSSSKAGAATLAAMRNLGTGAFAVGVGAAFGYML
ncbi:uncharacterized protein LY89DRAFT_730344 [Mollisia scopiformis]|uniref:DUF7707 domain-containing protein n=1 Tax=Mollisia scopiformis TaxID=149040 RepID=A0A194XJ65_MOLSC|nr:uncharacterized protein LY89DRAFT_730344 [Mollisia scopiformis]KUJ20290.1 hypothetical protein LY89DRAFT_730344 [Mollisia scopiformis]